jgi:hypothetical protein
MVVILRVLIFPSDGLRQHADPVTYASAEIYLIRGPSSRRENLFLRRFEALIELDQEFRDRQRHGAFAM